MRSLVVATLCAVVLAGSAGPAEAARARVDDPGQWAGYEIGVLRIPAIGVEELVREGVAQAVIDRGVAHWLGTAAPGGEGNLVLAGHRTLGTAPFYHLDRLRPGDLVSVAWTEGPEATYRVTEIFVVSPADIWIVDWTPQPSLTMFSCHPKGSARQRIVVRAELVQVDSAIWLDRIV